MLKHIFLVILILLAAEVYAAEGELDLGNLNIPGGSATGTVTGGGAEDVSGDLALNDGSNNQVEGAEVTSNGEIDKADKIKRTGGPGQDFEAEDTKKIRSTGSSVNIEQAKQVTLPDAAYQDVTDLTLNDDGSATAESVKKFNQNDQLIITDATNLKVDPDGTVHVEEATIIDFRGVQNSEVKNFNGNKENRKYHIDYAESVRAGCFDAREVKDADIEINSNLILETLKDTAFDIYYGFRNRLKYNSINTDNQLVFDPGACSIPFYQIRGINLTIPAPNAIETIEASNEAGVTLSRDHGVECIDFIPTGTYTYTPNEIRNAFAIRAAQENHQVCIKKGVAQHLPECEQCTNVNLNDGEIAINGKIEYMRLQYNDELDPINILSSGLTDYYTTLATSKSRLHLSPDLHQVTKVDASNPVADDDLQITNWLTFIHYRDQRDAYYNLQIQDYSEPLANLYQAPAFENIETDDTMISAGQYLFYYPNSETSEQFFKTLIQRRDLNFPTEAQN